MTGTKEEEITGDTFFVLLRIILCYNLVSNNVKTLIRRKGGEGERGGETCDACIYWAHMEDGYYRSHGDGEMKGF